MTKRQGQLAITLAALVSLSLGILAMLRVPTMILPPWFLVILYVPIIVVVSFVLGVLIKVVARVKASRFTLTSIFVTIFSLAFYVSEHRPSREILVPENFDGEVKLFLSNEDTDDFHLNRYGVGYISENTYSNGFKPKVFQNGENITNRLRDYAEGSISFGGVDGNVIGPYKYLSFKVSADARDTFWTDLMKVLELNAIDTTRILKESNDIAF